MSPLAANEQHMKQSSVIVAAVVCLLVIGLGHSASAGQPIFPSAYLHAGQAAPATGDDETPPLRLLWYGMLTPPINILSMAGLAGKRNWLKENYFNATDILHNEGLHKLNNTRYKEWWYYDVHDDSGFVMSCSIVFSIVPDHFFLWIYDPVQDKVFVELEQDGAFTVNTFGNEGQKLSSDNLTIEGRSDTGYTLTFSGKTLQGTFVYSDPIPGRGELHEGPLMTYYALYQVPKMKVTGLVKNKETGNTTAISGLGYHDHWWGIDSRYTKWEWMQAKFDNGWTASFYQARYDKRETDLHRYAWLYIPEKGYIYFDNSTSFDFHEDTESQQWTASISGTAGKLTLTAAKRVERYQFKPVVLYNIPLGEVRYHQYPINTTGTFTDAEGHVTPLNSSHGMLEWDWDAIW
jgi:hypothetical protein